MKERGSNMNWNSTQPEKQFLKRLRARRQLLGFTQAEATKLLPKPAPKYWWIGRVENGEVKITTKRLIQMCRILRVTPNWLLGFEDDDRYLDLREAGIQIIGQDECERYDWDETVLAVLIKAKLINGGINYDGQELPRGIEATSEA